MRLPKEFRFDSTGVHIQRDQVTRGVILSRKPKCRDGLFALDATIEAPDDFMTGADRKQQPETRDPFERWEE